MPVVLIADDDADHRELLELTLLRHGYDVVAAADSASARARLAAGGIDVALVDVRMPGESGIDLCADLRSDPRTADLPLMLVSAEAGDKRITDGLAAGADDYLIKPFNRHELVVRLDGLITRTARLDPARAARLAARAAGRLVHAAGALTGEASRSAAVRVA